MKKRLRRPPPENPTLPATPATFLAEPLLTELGVQAWDLLIVGDGSGSSWGRAAGWAAVAIERRWQSEPRLFYGSMNTGTSNVAEIFPYLHALTWFHTSCVDRNLLGRTPQRIHVVSDSEYVVRMGRRSGYSDSTANRGLWVAIEMIARQGFVIAWHFRPRESSIMNQFADRLSRKCRENLETAGLPELAAADAGLPPGSLVSVTDMQVRIPQPRSSHGRRRPHAQPAEPA